MRLTCAREQTRALRVNICLMVILDGKARRLYYRVMFPSSGHKVRKSVQQHKQTPFCSSRQVAQLCFTVEDDVKFWILGKTANTKSYHGSLSLGCCTVSSRWKMKCFLRTSALTVSSRSRSALVGGIQGARSCKQKHDPVSKACVSSPRTPADDTRSGSALGTGLI